MSNKVYYVSKDEMIKLKETLDKNDSIFIAEIEGDNIHNLEDYLSTINMIFKFPIPAHGLDSYFDWIRDLDWLMKYGYILIINNFTKFMSEDVQMKNKIIEGFENVVFPWWQEEVEKYVVEGKSKPFNVYLVD